MPTSTYVALATVTLASTDSEIVFSSIPASYRDLIFVMNGTSTTATDVTMQINNNSDSIYTSVRMLGDGTSTVSSTTSGTSGIWLRFSDPPTTGSNIVQFMDYAQTDKHKTILIRYDNENSLTAARAARWGSTNAIDTFKVTSGAHSFSIGSTFSLYGIEA
jgi:hypothetical protein